MDIVGPLPRSSTGHRYILVLIDYATRDPEAIPLRVVAVPQIAEELIKWTARVGITKEILTYLGWNFMSGVLWVVCHSLRKTFEDLPLPSPD